MKWEGCLAACGRGTDEELGAPVADDRANLKDRSGSLDLNQGDDRRSGCDGHGSVHRNAQRAMIGIAGDRMLVHHLNDRKQGQQRQTQRRDSQGCTGP